MLTDFNRAKREVHTWTINSRHNKPKKANEKVIPDVLYFALVNVFSVFQILFHLTNLAHLYIVAHYVCTAEDFAVIESIMFAPRDSKFVDIGDTLLSNDDLTCLTRDDGFLPDDVSQYSLSPLFTR